MKSIFSFKVNLGNIKGAISSVKNFKSEIQKAKSSFGDLGKAAIDASGHIGGALSKSVNVMNKLKAAAGATKNAFDKLGHSIRALTSNFLGKFISVLKTGLGIVGALTSAVMGIFNMANGTNRTKSQGDMNGLSWAGQKALNNANEEIGYDVNLGGIAQAISTPDAQTEAAKHLLSSLGIDLGSYKPGESYKAYNDISKGLYSEFKRLLDSGMDRMVAVEQMKGQYGTSIEELLGTDLQTALRAEDTGIMGRHRERFGATLSRYQGVDVNALMRGERALDDFSETLKAFALNVAAKVLPPLTSMMKKFTGYVSKAMNWVDKSGVIETLANNIGRVIGAFTQIIETVSGAFSSTTGTTVIDFIKGIFNFIGNLAELIANIVSGNWSGVMKNAKDMWGQTKSFTEGAAKVTVGIVGKAAEIGAVATNKIFGTEIDAKKVGEATENGMNKAYDKVKEVGNKITEDASERISKGASLKDIIMDENSEFRKAGKALGDMLYGRNREEPKQPVNLTVNAITNVDGKQLAVNVQKARYDDITQAGIQTNTVSRSLY